MNRQALAFEAKEGGATRDGLLGKRILAALSDGKTADYFRVCELLRLDKTKAYSSFYELRGRGLIRHVGHQRSGEWQITEKGTDYFSHYANDDRIVRPGGQPAASVPPAAAPAKPKESLVTVRQDAFPYRKAAARLLVEMRKIGVPCGPALVASRLGRLRQGTWTAMDALAGKGRLINVGDGRYRLSERGEAEARYWERTLGPMAGPDEVTSFDPEPDEEEPAAEAEQEEDAPAPKEGAYASVLEWRARTASGQAAPEEINWAREYIVIANKMADALASSGRNG